MTEIYLDSAATSLHKPPQVAQAVAEAICKAGNAARSSGVPGRRNILRPSGSYRP